MQPASRPPVQVFGGAAAGHREDRPPPLWRAVEAPFGWGPDDAFGAGPETDRAALCQQPARAAPPAWPPHPGPTAFRPASPRWYPSPALPPRRQMPSPALQSAGDAQRQLALVRSCGLRAPFGDYVSLIDRLTGEGHSRAGLDVLLWLVSDHRALPGPRTRDFVLDALVWAQHYDEAAELLVLFHRQRVVIAPTRIRRLVRLMEEAGFAAGAALLRRQLGL